MWRPVFACLMLAPVPAFPQGDALVAARLIRPAQVLVAGDIVPGPAPVAGAATDPAQVVGLEARVALYPGRPVLLADLGPAAVIERNDVVRLVFRTGGLTIHAEGRAMGRAAMGQGVSVMNLTSRQIVQGTALHPGLVQVGGASALH